MNTEQIKNYYETATGHLITESLNGPDMLAKKEVWVSGLEKWRTWEQLATELEEIRANA